MHCCRFFSPTLPPSLPLLTPSSHPPLSLLPSLSSHPPLSLLPSLSSHPPSLPSSMCALCVHSCVGRVTKIDDYEIVQIRLPRHIAADHVRHTHTQVHLVHNPHTRTHTLHALCVQCCGTYVCMPTTHVLCTYVRLLHMSCVCTYVHLLHMSCVRMYACYICPVYVRMYACYTCPVYVCTPATHVLCMYVCLLHMSFLLTDCTAILPFLCQWHSILYGM